MYNCILYDLPILCNIMEVDVNKHCTRKEFVSFFAFDRDAPFSKEELTAILKFRAEELFKEADGEETELPVRFICDFT